MDIIVGRDNEKKELEDAYASKEAELIAVYGRRRVGKTHLVRNFYSKKRCLFFCVTGIKYGLIQVQLERFAKMLGEIFYSGAQLKSPATWMEAFQQLSEAIRSISKKKKIVLFFDELPWLASKKSGVLQALEYFWNQYWVNDVRLNLVICGSSASWMIKKIIKNRGGLHNRITRRINLMPFNLRESKYFLEKMGVKLKSPHLVRLYMAMGGVPYYLKQVKKRFSADQNINKLFFNQGGLFLDEFDEVFASLFDDSDAYKELITIISKSREGILRSTIEEKSKLTGKGGRLTKRLYDLEVSGFISRHIPIGHKKRGIYYRVTDEYCLFYLKWIEPVKHQLIREKNSNYWLEMVNTPAYNSWSGYAFENICYKHIQQIKKKLQLPSIVLGSSWRYSPKKSSEQSGAQIDLLFVRTDKAITLCEIKYTKNPYVLDKSAYNNLRDKLAIYERETRKNLQCFFVLISAQGIRSTKYSDDLISEVITLEDLL